MEEEVFTPSRGGGGRPAPEPQGAPREVQTVPKYFQEDTVRGWRSRSEECRIADRYVSEHGVAHEAERLGHTPE